MIRKFVVFILIAVFFTGAALVLAEGSLQKKGRVTYAKGRVKRKPLDQDLWHNAPINTEVLSGDKVRTFRGSRAEINLAELDVIRLAPKTTVDIVKLYREMEDKKAETQIVVNSGEIWADIHEIESDTKFDISSSVASAAITGTRLRLKVNADSTTTLKVYKGEVYFTNAPEKTSLEPKTIKPHQIEGPHEVQGPHEVSLKEWLYIVKSMQEITVDNKGKVVSAKSFDLSDRDEQTKWVKWNTARDSVRVQKLKKEK